MDPYLSSCDVSFSRHFVLSALHAAPCANVPRPKKNEPMAHEPDEAEAQQLASEVARGEDAGGGNHSDENQAAIGG